VEEFELATRALVRHAVRIAEQVEQNRSFLVVITLGLQKPRLQGGYDFATPVAIAQVRRKFDEVFARTQRRLFISCFSSSIHRIKLAVELAHEHGRKVAFIGRSMTSSAEIAADLGYMDIPDGLLIHPGEMKNFAPEKVCVMISGTQGEPMSALSRAAVDNHKHAKIEKGDTVVLSSRIIPGNEKTIYRMVDHLFRE